MTGYTEGKHNDPADTQDRLLRVGTKYQSIAPSVADGDNVHLLVDSAGRPIVVGPAASDSPQVGNPVQIGGSVDDTSPSTAGEGNVRRFRASPEGNFIVELYKDSDALSPISATPGASEVKSLYFATTAPSTARKTLVTPTSGRRIRVISIELSNNSGANTRTGLQVYFGTGADIATASAKAIAYAQVDRDNYGNIYRSWPDGGGPVGAVDDAVSMVTGADVGSDCFGVIHYREE